MRHHMFHNWVWREGVGEIIRPPEEPSRGSSSLNSCTCRLHPPIPLANVDLLYLSHRRFRLQSLAVNWQVGNLRARWAAPERLCRNRVGVRAHTQTGRKMGCLIRTEGFYLSGLAHHLIHTSALTYSIGVFSSVIICLFGGLARESYITHSCFKCSNMYGIALIENSGSTRQVPFPSRIILPCKVSI